MNQSEWLNCIDPKVMIEASASQMSDHQLKKFSVACHHEIQSLLTDEAKAAVKAFEADIDGKIDPDALSSAKGLLESEVFDSSSSGTIGGIVSDYVLMLFSSSALETTQDALDAVDRVIPWTLNPSQKKPEVYEAECAKARQTHMARLADRLREIVGKPFQVSAKSAIKP
jgi:hypothetical protein